MPRLFYSKKKFNDEKLGMIHKVNALVIEYQRQGYRLTLRQIYYRLVASNAFPPGRKYRSVGGKWIADPENGTNNAEPNYKWLGEILGDARMAGLIDWNAIEDRTRELAGVSHWGSPADIIRACHHSFRLDKWDTQQFRCEVWVEKDALEGIAKQAANGQDVDAFSCRGYGSLSSLWEAAQRLYKYVKAGQRPVIIHLGDHDPSGVDMTRDITERLNLFLETDWLRQRMPKVDNVTRGTIWSDIEDHFRDTHGKVAKSLIEDDLIKQRMKHPEGGTYGMPVQIIRVALNMDQIEKYNPPPNPAKSTDSRFKSYQDKYGDESWELDALEPSVLDDLITTTIARYRNDTAFTLREKDEEGDRDNLKKASENWNGAVVPLLSKL